LPSRAGPAAPIAHDGTIAERSLVFTTRGTAATIPEDAVLADISDNIHLLSMPLPGEEAESATSPPQIKKHGAIIVLLVAIAGVGADLFVWKNCGKDHVAAIPSYVPAVKYPGGGLPPPQGTAAASMPMARPIEALPLRSHIEISVQSENATVVLDGKPLPGNQFKGDVPADRDLRGCSVVLLTCMPRGQS
jgi:hypothetical protein